MTREEIAEIMRKYENKTGRLLGILEDIEKEEGYISRESMELVAEALKIPVSKVYEVATFYSFFNLKPVGKHIITVCMGTACHVKGASRILEALEELLGVNPGEVTDDGKFMLTTKDREFTVNTARCFGACSMAPVIRIDEKIYGYVNLDKIPNILKEYGWKKEK